VKLTSSDKRFSLLKPIVSAPRLDQIYLAESVDDFLCYVNDIPATEKAVALDFETRGNVPAHPDFRAVGVGLSCSIGSMYLDLSWAEAENQRRILEKVIHLPLIAHNAYFDLSVFYKLGFQLDSINTLACTYVLYKQLANEGFLQQSWGLKSAMIDMLGWPETNEEGIDLWLIRNGYITNESQLRALDTPEKREARYNERDKNGGRKLKPDKGEMWRVPAGILGRYCAMDADATWQLYTEVLYPATLRIPPQTAMLHNEGFIPLIKALIENHFDGMTVDAEGMQTRLSELDAEIVSLNAQLRELPLLKEFIEEKEAQWLSEITVPEQFKKDGKPSKNYENYLKKLEEIKAGTNEKLNKDFRFNPNGDELGEFIYERYVTFEVIREPMPDNRGRIRITGGNGKAGFELDMTESGKLPTNKDAFPALGDLGALLARLSKTQKLQGYVSAGLAKLSECGDGVAHPQYRVHGTLTGRLAGGGDSELKANYQQLPSDDAYLKCYHSPPGMVLVQADFAALEPHALAELSRSKKYLELYGPGAKAHDIYLFNGLNLRYFKKKITESGYDPDKPETVEEAKSVCKKERNILKVLTLSSAYGAGPGKICATLKMQGVDMSFEEVQQIHADYWGPELYGDVKEFERELLRELKENQGWVLDGLGCATCVDEKFKKDLINRVIQRTGHEILILFLFKFLKPRLVKAGIRFKWYLPDLHDETIYAVPKEQAIQAMEIHRAAVDELNSWLGGVTSHNMEPKLINNLAERKVDEKNILLELEESM
jgi:DNA polymerase I-like protein with 3'-5' exonuclease and polymerase domains